MYFRYNTYILRNPLPSPAVYPFANKKKKNIPVKLSKPFNKLTRRHPEIRHQIA